MARSALKNSAGVSLIEVLVSLVVTLFVFLGLMQTALLGLDANLKNQLRDEAVTIAETQMNAARNTPNPVDDAMIVTRSFRNIDNFTYTVAQDVTDLGETTSIVIQVDWAYRNQPFTHSITSVMQ